MKGALVVHSIRNEIFPSKAAVERCWQAFLKDGTNHSRNASLLPYLINRCEKEGVSYVLTAVPGTGYHLEKGPAL